MILYMKLHIFIKNFALLFTYHFYVLNVNVSLSLFIVNLNYGDVNYHIYEI